MIFVDFATGVQALKEPQRIKSFRYQVQTALEDYINDNQYDARGRFGEILLLLPPLQSISLQMINQIQLARMLGSAKIHSLLHEMLLTNNNMPFPLTAHPLAPQPSAPQQVAQPSAANTNPSSIMPMQMMTGHPYERKHKLINKRS